MWQPLKHAHNFLGIIVHIQNLENTSKIKIKIRKNVQNNDSDIIHKIQRVLRNIKASLLKTMYLVNQRFYLFDLFRHA